MSVIDVLRTDGRGRTRPAPPWRRHPAAALRLSRLARELEAERDRYEGHVFDLLDRAVVIVDDVAAAITPPPAAAD